MSQKLLEHIDLGKLDVVGLCTDGQDMSQELLGVVSAPTNNTLCTSGDGTPMIGVWGTALMDGLVPGVLSFSFPVKQKQ